MFSFGQQSEKELQGVHTSLIAVVREALQESEIDFSVHDGLRTPETQAEYVISGASQKILSRHLTGHAVDLYPFVVGKTRTDDALCFPIAEAMRLASVKLGILIEWGGAWNRNLSKFPTARDARKSYLTFKAMTGGKPFNDLFHFQLPEKEYPANPQDAQRLEQIVRQAICDIKDERGLV